MGENSAEWSGVLFSLEDRDEFKRQFGVVLGGSDCQMTSVTTADGRKLFGLQPGVAPPKQHVRISKDASEKYSKAELQKIKWQIIRSFEGKHVTTDAGGRAVNRVKVVPITDKWHPVYRPGENPSYGAILRSRDSDPNPLPAKTVIGPPYGGVLARSEETDALDQASADDGGVKRWEYAFDIAMHLDFAPKQKTKEDPGQISKFIAIRDSTYLTRKNALSRADLATKGVDGGGGDIRLADDVGAEWNIDALDYHSVLARVNDPRGYNLALQKRRDAHQQNGDSTPIPEIEPNLEPIIVYIYNIPHVFFITTRKIRQNEELLVSYGERYWSCFELRCMFKQDAQRCAAELARLQVKLEKSKEEGERIEMLESQLNDLQIAINSREEINKRMAQRDRGQRAAKVFSESVESSMPICIYSLAAEMCESGSRHPAGLDVKDHWEKRCCYARKENTLLKKCNDCGIPFFRAEFIEEVHELFCEKMKSFEEHDCPAAQALIEFEKKSAADDFTERFQAISSNVLQKLSADVEKMINGKLPATVDSGFCGGEVPRRYSTGADSALSLSRSTRRFAERLESRGSVTCKLTTSEMAPLILDSMLNDELLVKFLWIYVIEIWPNVTSAWRKSVERALLPEKVDYASLQQAVTLIIKFESMVFDPHTPPHLRWVISLAQLLSFYFDVLDPLNETAMPVSLAAGDVPRLLSAWYTTRERLKRPNEWHVNVESDVQMS